MAVSKDIVQRFVESVLKSEGLEDSFSNYYTKYDDDEKADNNIGIQNQGLRRMLAVGASQEPEIIVKHYVNMMTQVKASSKFEILFDMLASFVQQNNMLGKAVCESLLSCDKLELDNQVLWIKSFKLISKILPTLDYKGVRDILKQLLQIIYSLPQNFDRSLVPQLDALFYTVARILDKNNSLLPAYLALDELQKKIAQSSSPVWKFADLFHHFIETFKPTAQIVSIVNRSSLLPIAGCGFISWVLDPSTAKFDLKGLLPYRDELKLPQVDQLRYILRQPYSRETLCTILKINLKSSARCAELIEQIAITFIEAMELSEPSISSLSKLNASSKENIFIWLHLASNLLFFVVFHRSTLTTLVDALCTKIKSKNITKGREHLMWSFLQYITADVQNITIHDLMPLMKLFDVLYPERSPLPVPDIDNSTCSHIFAAASIWIYLVKKAESDDIPFMRPIPPAIQAHYEFLTKLGANIDSGIRVSFKEAIYSNLHCYNKSIYPNTNFVDCLSKIDPISNPNPDGCLPLSVELIDTLTANSKKSLMHALSHRIVLLANKNQNKYKLTPALIETYSRLLVYTDIESFGLKNLMNSILGGNTAVWRTHAWDVYHVLLEMYSHRIHHVPYHYKMQLLLQLHTFPSVSYTFNHTQLCLTMEATELKLLLDLTCNETINIHLSIPRNPESNYTKQLISDSEELNKVLILVLARTTNIMSTESQSQGFLDDFINEVMAVTPLSWSQTTLNFFPSQLRDFFSKNQPPKNDKALLRPAVEEEYRKWNSMIGNERNLINHFSQTNGLPLFICVLWKMVLDKGTLNPVVYQILSAIRLKTLSNHLRTFVEYLVYEFSNSSGGQDVNRYAEALSDLIKKYYIITLDKFLLAMCLSSLDIKESQVCFFIINLLLKKLEFKTMIQTFMKYYTPEHWKENPACYENHRLFQAQYPEKYYTDFLAERNIPTNHSTLPSFFRNTCLRFIPVFDLLIHRALELEILLGDKSSLAIKIEVLLNDYGSIYKFHNKPLTYLYNTLHYYDSRLDATLKRKLTSVIVSAFESIKPPDWCLTEPFKTYLKNCNDPIKKERGLDKWIPNQQYYHQLIGRLVDALADKPVFPHADWRFNEFLNAKSHAVYATTIELMTIPQPSNIVASSVFDLVLNSHIHHDKETTAQWMNAIGLVMTNLPNSYLSELNTKILEYMRSPLLKNTEYTKDIFHTMNFCDNHDSMYETNPGHLIGLTHAIWNHANIGQIYSFPVVFLREIKHVVTTESQFLFVCSLIGPFMSRLERSRLLMDTAVDLYQILIKVDASTELVHLNTICDFLYHIKYMFIGNAVEGAIESCIKKFKPRLQNALKFMTHLNVQP